jgi:hypothetical protein
MDVWESRARLAPVLTEASSWMLLGNYLRVEIKNHRPTNGANVLANKATLTVRQIAASLCSLRFNVSSRC